MNDEKNMKGEEEDYICHIIIPSKDYQRSRIFFENVFGWKVEQQPGTSYMDVTPTSGKGPSAELNSEAETITPSIYITDIEEKLRLIEKHGGKKLKDKTPVDEDPEHGYYALFEDPQGNKMCLYSEK